MRAQAGECRDRQHEELLDVAIAQTRRAAPSAASMLALMGCVRARSATARNRRRRRALSSARSQPPATPLCTPGGRMHYERRFFDAHAVRFLTLALVVPVLAGACDRAPATSALFDHAVNRASLTGAALAALGEDGRFRRQDPLAGAPVPAYSQRAAESLARQYWSKFGPMFRESASRRRGAPIRHGRLLPCGAAALADSPYESPAPADLTLTRAFMGPQWIVPFCDGAEVGLVISVAAFAAGLAEGDLASASGEFLNATFSECRVSPSAPSWHSPPRMPRSTWLERPAHASKRCRGC